MAVPVWRCVILLAVITGTWADVRPHIVFVMMDDYGWANVGFHAQSQPNAKEVVTPNIDALAKAGVILDRHYAYRFCSPSRSSLHTGRNPIHVNTGNDPLTLYNASDPVSGFAGIPLNMTAFPQKLQAAGYRTVQAGKWHIGLATPGHTPRGRGYQQSLTYLDGSNDYWTSITSEYCQTGPHSGDPYTDLWLNINGTEGPARGMNNSWACSQQHQPASCRYEDEIFTQFAIDAINSHDINTPLFLYFAPHNVHQPLEVPAARLAKFSFITDSRRQAYAAMTNLADTHIGNVVAALQKRGMWSQTLLVLSADNGGPIYRNGAAGANNFPLRGGKKSNWEGGVRVNALVSGGYLPTTQQGRVEPGLVAMEDWYRTFCGLAHADPTDDAAARAGLPPVEGYDMWPLISGAVSASPRSEVWLGSGGLGDEDTSAHPLVQGLLRADGYKILIGKVIEDTWTGPFYPNASTHWCDTCARDCGWLGNASCLFNVFQDPTEHTNLAETHPDILAAMSDRLAQLQRTVFAPQRGTVSALACAAGDQTWSGFAGPFLP